MLDNLIKDLATKKDNQTQKEKEESKNFESELWRSVTLAKKGISKFTKSSDRNEEHLQILAVTKSVFEKLFKNPQLIPSFSKKQKQTIEDFFDKLLIQIASYCE
jgi:hypothetical protein